MTQRSEQPTGRSVPPAPPRTEDFDAYYAGTPPWDIGRPQAAFLALAENGKVTGRVLDAGCGTGEHALMAAGLGLECTGVDISPRAIESARRKATERGCTVSFVVGDALDLAALGCQFDTILDCGLFHIFDDDDRVRYVHSLGSVLAPGGSCFILCFSDKQPGLWGPRRISRPDLEESFTGNLRIESIEETRLEITIDPAGAQGWLVSLSGRPIGEE